MKHNELFDQRHNFYLDTSSTARGGLILLLLLGVGTFIGGMVSGEFARTWGSFLFNLLFFFSIALGGAAFGSMQDVVGAVWGRPIKRLHESLSAFVPWALALMVLFLIAIRFDLLGAGKVYSWVADPSIVEHFEGKNVWLRLDFMVIRDLVAIVVIFLLRHWHMRQTTAADLALVAGRQDEAARMAEASRASLRYWSAPVLVGYAFAFSLLCFDLTMSLAPTWFSTLWAGWSFSIMMQTLMASILLLMFVLKDKPIGHYIRQQQFHDIGKLMHGFTVFFAYLTYAHVLTYWYTNMPEETSYFLARMQWPWLGFIIVLPIFNFVLPLFALIPKVSKWAAPITIPIALFILISQWFTYMIVVIPEVVDHKNWSFPWIEMGLFCGFLGMFLFAFLSFAKKVPMLAISDPLLPAALQEGHH